MLPGCFRSPFGIRAASFLALCLAGSAAPGWTGNELHPRAELDDIPHLTVIDLGLCATVAGAVDGVEAHLDARASQGEEGPPTGAWLQVWRPGLRRPVRGAPGAGQRAWRLVTQVGIAWLPSELGRSVVFDLRQSPLPMAVGDCLGWYGGAGAGVVPYDKSEDGGHQGVVWAFGMRVVRFGGNELTVMTGWAPRTYSWRVRRSPLDFAMAGRWMHRQWSEGTARLRSVGRGATSWKGDGASESAKDYQGQSLPPGADGWLPSDNIPRLCAEEDLVQAACPDLEPSRLNKIGPLKWRDILGQMCSCTAGQSLIGKAAETQGACCDLDALDSAMNAAGHPKGAVCLHGTLALLAACSAKLSLRHRPPHVSAALASPALRSRLAGPGLVHLGSPVLIRAAPRAYPEVDGPSEDWWDLEIEPKMRAEPGQRHTYRLRGAALNATFAPFPFGSKDLLWWRAADFGEKLELLSEVLVGLTVSGVSAVAFAGSLAFLRGQTPEGEARPLDVLAPWAAREEVLRFAEEWRGASPTWRHVVELPRRVELGVLPSPSLRALWPSDFGFKVVCPGCAHVVVRFHLPRAVDGGHAQEDAGGPEDSVIVVDGEMPCAWPSKLLFPPKWLDVEEAVRLWDPSVARHAISRQVDSPELPWPADPVLALELLAKAPPRLGEDGQERDASAGACWPELSTAAKAAGVGVDRLGFSRLFHVAPEFDLHSQLRAGVGFYDLFDLRKEAAAAELGLLMDKAALKARLQAEGLPVAPVVHVSYESPEVRGVLQGLKRYAVKAAHRHHGGHGVVLVDNGKDLRSGRPIDIEEVQAKVLGMWPRDPDAGRERCVKHADGTPQCVTNAPAADRELRPAVIVEGLAQTWDGREGLLADEAFCFVAWGRLVLCGVMGPGGVWAGYLTRDGTPVYMSTMHAELGTRDVAGAALRPAVPWSAKLRRDVVDLAERTAATVAADFVRVDVFPNGGRPFIAEVSIVSGWLGRRNLRWGEIDAWMLELFYERWADGYGQAFGSIGP